MNRYRTFAPRFVALVLDLVILLPLSIVTDMFANPDGDQIVRTAVFAAANVLNVLYFFILHAVFGQTAGKYLMKVRVVDAEKEGPIGFRRSFIRELPQVMGVILTLIPALSLPVAGHPDAPLTLATIPIFIWGAADIIVFLTNEKRRALHDLIAGTVVVRLDSSDRQN